MKNFLIILFLLVGVKTEFIFGQIILSNGTGGGFWDDSGTWSGGTIPGIGNDVIIQGTDSVYTGSGATCNNLTIQSGTKFATSTDSVHVEGSLTLEANAFFYNRATEKPKVPGSIVNLDPASTVVHIGSGTVGGEGNLEFGNLIIQRNAGVTAGGNLIIHGDLTMRMDAQNRYFRAADDESGSQTQTVEGNLYIHRGTLSCVDAGDTPSPDIVGIWNINGNVYVYGSGASGTVPYDARIGPFSSASAMGYGILNIQGSLIIDGGRLQGGTSSTPSTGTAIINIGKDLSLSNNSSIGGTTHSGPFAINFVGIGSQTVTFRRNLSIGYPISDTIKSGSNVIFDLADSSWGSTVASGDFVVNGSLDMVGSSNIAGQSNFILNPGGTLKIGSSDGISLTGTTGNILVTGTRAYSPEANYEYKGTGMQEIGDGLPNPVAGFAVNNPDSIVLRGTLNITNSLNVINGNLDLNNNTIALGPNAILTETPGNTIKGLLGKITITTNVVNPSALNVGGLGAILTTGNDLGNTTIERFHSAATGNGNHGILRQYNIIPGQNNSGLNATVKLYYDDSELNGLTEDGLRLFKSPNGTDNSWTHLGGTVNTTENYVELSGITDFSYWTLADINSTLPVEEENNKLPEKYFLHQNYPNPFNPETAIKFEIPEASFVNLTIYNSLGEKIVTLVNEQMAIGIYKRDFDGRNLSSGVYIYRLTANEKTFTQKMLMIK